MLKKFSLPLSGIIAIVFGTTVAQAQVLTLKEAVQTGLQNYNAIKAKASYVSASKASVKQSVKEYYPDLSVSFQHDYGTVNGQTGPLYGFRGLGTASSGQPLADQNWNAAFGALYLTNINWDFYSFGRAREKIKTAQAVVARDESDLVQEQFQHEVRVAAAYLNLLAAQRLTQSWQNNLDRAVALQGIVTTRVKNGLNAGVDSSLANAEVSNARIVLTRARDYEQEQANQLAILMGVQHQVFTLDSVFVARIPTALYDSGSSKQVHPLLAFYQRRIDLSNEQAKYFKTLSYPTFTLFGVFQGRGSGFDPEYGINDLNKFSRSYLKGIDPVRANYLFGVGMIWNLTTPLRVQQQVTSQKFISQALKEEYELTDQRLKAQLALSDNKIKNALDNYREVPVQVKAASDAFLQKSVLYKNGLTNMVDVTQALYALNRAETDRAITYNNVWQALLLKAAASGDFALFINEF
ncbi:TolC family protein [Paraflavitalea sp. CAU 1676]|uniref:TolC family protein n=1 Tax=Paraflavitalea sp. CAU 1676 TaxID=3032598 RepID=UPI0023DB61EC|nr:TolC family protein [Paraflavitalea sp. CAU 1676]MDF2192275.1 TolC family protein [Paraflavitalea sp. CAU 1676]